MKEPTFAGELEIRATESETVIAGSFPWEVRATDRPEAFATNSLTSTGEVRLLYGHDSRLPLASEPAESLHISTDAAGLHFRATLPPAARQTSWQRDAVSAIEQRLSTGLSPGFTVQEERHTGGVRHIQQAVLHELSVVVKPAYATEVTLREQSHELAVKVHQL